MYEYAFKKFSLFVIPTLVARSSAALFVFAYVAAAPFSSSASLLPSLISYCRSRRQSRSRWRTRRSRNHLCRRVMCSCCCHPVYMSFSRVSCKIARQPASHNVVVNRPSLDCLVSKLLLNSGTKSYIQKLISWIMYEYYLFTTSVYTCICMYIGYTDVRGVVKYNH